MAVQSSSTKPAAVSQPVSQSSKIKQTVNNLEQRRAFLEKKVENERKLAVTKNKAGDKKSALLHLKRKKMHEAEIEKIDGTMINLEQQAMAIESTSNNLEIIKAMKTGKAAMDSMSKALQAEDIENLKDDIQEHFRQGETIDQIISQPLVDDLEDYESELAELEAEGVEQDLQGLPMPPVSKAKTTTSSFPAVPTHAVTDDDDAALAALEAEMAM